MSNLPTMSATEEHAEPAIEESTPPPTRTATKAMSAKKGLIEREAEKWEQWAANGPYYVQLSYEEGVRDGLLRALDIIEGGAEP